MLDQQNSRSAHAFLLAILFLLQVGLRLMDPKTIGSFLEYFYLVYLSMLLIAKDGL